MDKRFLRTLAAAFLGLTIVSGCRVGSGTSQQVQDSTAVVNLIENIDLVTDTPVPTVTQDESPQIAATSVPPSPTSVAEETNARLCQALPKRFSIHDALGIERLAGLRFISEELLDFEGWKQRPEPSVIPVTPEATPDERPVPNSSNRMLLSGGQLDLTNETLTPRPLNVNAVLANPCGENCPLEVIGQSADGNWQLVQISDWLQEKMGLWLVSEVSTVQLVPYVPSDPRWRWADDNSLLWLSYGDAEQGSYTIVAQLSEQPSITRSEYGSLLDPFFNVVDFSPKDHTARTVPSFESGSSRTDQVVTVVLTDGSEIARSTETVSGVVSVSWNEATQSFMVQTVLDEGITFQELSGDLLLKIPQETLEALFPSFTTVTDSLPFGIASASNWTISALGSKLALLHSSGEIWIFDCAAAP
jgi:hypothetical protein